MTTLDILISTSGPILFLIGGYSLALSYSNYHQIAHTIKMAKPYEGTIIEMWDDPDHLPSDMAYLGKAPVVKFRTPYGLYQCFSTAYRKKSHYNAGQTVKKYFYLYKFRREIAVVDDKPMTQSKTLVKWGLAFVWTGIRYYCQN